MNPKQNRQVSEESASSMRPWQRSIDVLFRILAITLPIAAVAWLFFNTEGSERDGPSVVPLMAGFITAPIGLVAALKGVDFSAESRTHRLHGLYTIGLGIAVFACGLVGLLLINYALQGLPGLILIDTGVLLVGLAGVVLGILEVITGHSLAEEVGLWRGRNR